MARTKLQLMMPEAAGVIDSLHSKERDPWRKNRLLAIKLAARGEHSAAQVADLCGIARGHLFAWIKTVRTDGLEALLQRGKPGPKGGSCRGVPDEVITELKTRLQAGEFITGMDAVRWLKEAHGIERPYNTVWQWLKKAGGVLLAPRPSHSKKDPAAAQAFKEGLAELSKSGAEWWLAGRRGSRREATECVCEMRRQ